MRFLSLVASLAGFAGFASAQGYGPAAPTCAQNNSIVGAVTVSDYYAQFNLNNNNFPAPKGNISVCNSIFTYRNFDNFAVRHAHPVSVLIIPNICEGPAILGARPLIYVDSMVAEGFYQNDRYNNRSLVFILPYLRPGRPSVSVQLQNVTEKPFVPLRGFLTVSDQPPPEVTSGANSTFLLSTSYNGSAWGYFLSTASAVNATVYASLRRVNSSCTTATPGQRDCTAAVFTFPIPGSLITPGKTFTTNFSAVLSFLNTSIIGLGYVGVASDADTLFVNVLPSVFESSTVGTTAVYAPQLVRRDRYETTLSAAATVEATKATRTAYVCPFLVEYNGRGIWNTFYEGVPTYGRDCCGYGTSESACNSYDPGVDRLTKTCATYNTCKLNATRGNATEMLCRETSCTFDFLRELRSNPGLCAINQNASDNAYKGAAECESHVRKLTSWLTAQNYIAYAGGYCKARDPKPTTSVRRIAIVQGDPHYTTFDGLYYTEFGPGNNTDFIVLKAFEDDPAAELQLHSRPVRWPDTSRSTATMNSAYALRAGKNGDTVELYNLPGRSEPMVIYVGQLRIRINPFSSYSFNGGMIYRTNDPKFLFIDTDSGFSFAFQAWGVTPWIYEVKIWSPPDITARGGVRGLLGNADGNRTPINEFCLRNGTCTTNQRLFHDSWIARANELIISPTSVIDSRVRTRSIFAEWDMSEHEIRSIKARAEHSEREFHRRQADSSTSDITGISSANRSLEFCASMVPATATNAAALAAIRTECAALPVEAQCACAFDFGISYSSNDDQDRQRILDSTQLAALTTSIANGGVINVTVVASNSTALIQWAFDNNLVIGTRISVQQTPGVGGWKDFETGKGVTSFIFPEPLLPNTTYEVRLQAIYDVSLGATSQSGRVVRRAATEASRYVGAAAGAPFITTTQAVDLTKAGSGPGSTTPSGPDNVNNTTVIIAAVVGSVGGVAIIAGVVAGVVISQKKKQAKGLHVSSVNSLQPNMVM